MSQFRLGTRRPAPSLLAIRLWASAIRLWAPRLREPRLWEPRLWAPRLLALFFLAYGGTGVMAIACLMPPFQAADETNHADRADQIAGLGLLGLRQGGDTAGGIVDLGLDRASAAFDRLRFHPEIKTTRAMADQAAAADWRPRGPLAFPNTAIYPPFFYLPGALGILVGKHAGLSVLNTLLLARLVSGGVSVLIAAVAIGMAGGMAPLLFTVLCLPMSLALFASVSQDGPMIAASALGVALLGAPTGRSRLAVACVAVCLVAMARPAYLPLALIPALLWDNSWHRAAWRRRLVLAASTTVPVVGWIMLTGAVTLPHVTSAHTSQQIQALLANPGLAERIVVNTLARQVQEGGPYFREFVGVLGWLDTTLPNPYYAVTGIILIVATLAVILEPGTAPKPGPRPAPGPPGNASLLPMLLNGVLLVAAIVAVFVLEYLSWSPIGGGIVEGVQGRYFLPIALFLPLALPRRPEGHLARAAPIAIILLLYPAVSLALTLRAIVMRYYLG
ncbi:DUF2142 domain-containing protein [Lichenicola sp.]|uniref:DUF2142 domain-containing protein n=1 Tax=Lichenicola sp. TaxID=2804529 RepID=UPI003B003540